MFLRLMSRLASQPRQTTPWTSPPLAEEPWKLIRYFVTVVLLMVGSAVFYETAIHLHHNFVINLSASVAPGLYERVDRPVEPGSIVLFDPSADTLAWHAELTGMEGIETFLKPVYRLGPLTICREAGDLVLDDVALPASSLAPRFIELGQCIDFDAEKFFVLSTRIENSFDSRHYGPVSVSSVDGVFFPAFTWK